MRRLEKLNRRSRRARAAARLAARGAVLAATFAAALGSTACWEQVAPRWFPQMKEQPARQALEHTRPLAPPDGTIPLGGIAPRISDPIPAFSPLASELANPIPSSSDSIARGKYVFNIYCALCHGENGLVEQEASPPPLLQRLKMRGDTERAPGENMIPVTLENTPAYEDGFLFTKIRYGRPVMPGYPQIPAEDRWHVVNYLRSMFPRED